MLERIICEELVFISLKKHEDDNQQSVRVCLPQAVKCQIIFMIKDHVEMQCTWKKTARSFWHLMYLFTF